MKFQYFQKLSGLGLLVKASLVIAVANSDGFLYDYRIVKIYSLGIF